MLTSLGHWGLPGLAVMYFLEAMALPVPIEIPFVLSGVLLDSGVHSWVTLTLVAWAGTSAGNLTAFALARKGGRRLYLRLAGRWLHPHTLARIEDLVRRHGVGAVVITRWINWGFGLALWLVGLGRAPARTFVALVLLNNLLWAFAWVWLGGAVAHGMKAIGLPWWVVFIPAVLVFLIGYLIHRVRQKWPRPSGD